MGIQTVILSDGNQEYIAISDSDPVPDTLSMTSTHSKIFCSASGSQTVISLPPGSERGQLKIITLCKMDSTSITVDIVPTRFYNGTKIVLSRKGDQVRLVWTGFAWILFESINVTDPEFGPIVV